MAKIVNTFVSTDAVGNREELSDVVDLTQRTETPLYSMISKEGASSTYPEWETEAIEAADPDNARPEGDEYTFGAVTPAERMGNPTHIFEKDFVMSNTQEAVDNAGRAEQFARNKVRKGIAMRRDVEAAILRNRASVRGEDRRLGGLPTWLETNVSRGASTGANGGFNAGTGLTEVSVAGDQRAFTKTLVDNVMQDAHSNGARVDTIMVSLYAKRVFTTFQTDSNAPQFSYETRGDGMKGSTLTSNVTVYNGDFGRLDVIPNYLMTQLGTTYASNVWLLDKEKLAFKWLRKIQEDKDVATTKTGDGKKCVIIGEGTLKVKNERGLGVIADIYGTSAST